MPLTVRLLNVHDAYRCRHAGVCCRTGWAIPLDAGRLDGLRLALDTGQLRQPAGTTLAGSPFVTMPAPPHGSAAVLATDPDGACAFLEPGTGLCGIHRDVGHDALPEACQHFPRVGLVDRRGSFLTLSHYCPTAARLLVRHRSRLAIVTRPAARPSEGMDARDALPPLLRPDLLMDWADYDRWETLVIDTLADESSALHASLTRIVEDVERIRGWRPGPSTLSSLIIGVSRRPVGPAASPGLSGGPPRHDETLVQAILSAYEDVCGAVPEGLRRETAPDPGASEMRRRVWPALRDREPVVRRYLAARVFGSWLAYQGRGLRTVVAGLLIAWAVIQVEVARVMRSTPGALTADGLVTALGAADYLLVHLADARTLAARLAPVEDRERAERLRLLATTGRP